MVGLVIISHSKKLAEGVVDLAKMMAPDVPMAAAGGLEDGSFGTSFERILEAVNETCSEDGAILLMDMGSAVMTAEMVLESLDGQKMALADCPLVEGAVVAAVNAAGGMSFEAILQELEKVRDMKKLS